jgi:hypothetical protein
MNHLELTLLVLTAIVVVSCVWFIIRVNRRKKKNKSLAPLTLSIFYLMNLCGSLFLGIHILTASSFLNMKYSWLILISTTTSSVSFIFAAAFSAMLERSSKTVMKDKKFIYANVFLFTQFISINYIAIRVDIGAENHQLLQLIIGLEQLILGIYLMVVLYRVGKRLTGIFKKKMRLLMLGFFLDRILSIILYILFIDPGDLSTYLSWLSVILIVRTVGYILIEQSYWVKEEEDN